MQLNVSAVRPALTLSALTSGELREQALTNRFQKWATLALLRYLGLPTLDATFVPAHCGATEVHRQLVRFAEFLDVDQLMLRSDGGLEVAAYHRGGNTIPLAKAVEIAIELSDQGRAVIAMEPTNRFANRIVIGMVASRDGEFSFEILGPGYDASDLARGGVPPQWWVRGRTAAWTEYEEIDCARLEMHRDGTSESDRRRMRLENVAAYMITGASTDRPWTVVDAEQWLKTNGYTALWSEQACRLSCPTVRKWFDDLFLIASFYERESTWRVLSTSACRLDTGRFVYWDVVEGTRKWQLRPSRA
jgi:hypothetical protein